VIGVAFDGTGYGTDGAVWGGEVLVATYGSFERAAHLGYVPLAGGDAAVRRPYRMALAHLWAAGVPWTEDLPAVAVCPPAERTALAHQLRTGRGCVPTSSTGRLFDAVASLTGVRHVVDFEAQAAMELEARARAVGLEGEAGYRFGLPDAGPLVADPGPVIRAVADDVRAGVPAEVVGARFHAAVVVLLVEWARRIRAERGLSTVGLTGGVFQNAVLLSAAGRALAADGFFVLRHRVVPPNDGGLALGQLVAAACPPDERPGTR
jgi:hydrogenase maturation protein HypF